MSDPVSRLNAALEGRYTIERELGEGGMATVYLADDLKHERKVALKDWRLAIVLISARNRSAPTTAILGTSFTPMATASSSLQAVGAMGSAMFTSSPTGSRSFASGWETEGRLIAWACTRGTPTR